MTAQVSIDPELCKGCVRCLEACPVDVFRLGADGKAVAMYESDCHVCHQCEDDCPTGAITVAHAISHNRKVSIYDLPDLKLLTPDWQAG